MSKDWEVWCRSRKKDQEQRPYEVDGKEIFSNRSKQANLLLRPFALAATYHFHGVLW